MSTIKQRLQFIGLFLKHKKEIPKRIDFENTANTDKGVALYYDELVAGQPIFQKDPEGMLVPAPEGEHMMEDGTKVVIEIGADGMSMIKEVVPVAADPNATPDPNALADPSSAANTNDAAAKTRIRSIIEEVRFTVDAELDLENTYQALTENIKALQNELTEKEAKFSADKKLIEDENTSLREMLEELNKPAGEVTHQPQRSKFLTGQGDKKNDALDTIKRIRELTK